MSLKSLLLRPAYEISKYNRFTLTHRRHRSARTRNIWIRVAERLDLK